MPCAHCRAIASAMAGVQYVIFCLSNVRPDPHSLNFTVKMIAQLQARDLFENEILQDFPDLDSGLLCSIA